MKIINFIETKGFKFTYRRMLVVLAGFVLFSAMCFGFFHFRKVQMAGHFEDLAQSISALKQQQKEFVRDLSRQDGTAVEKGRKTLSGIFAEQNRWAPLFKEVADKTPPDLLLTGLHWDTQAEPVLVLKGIATSTSELSRFVKKLQGGLYVRNPILSETEVVVVDGRAVYKFTINCEVVPS